MFSRLKHSDPARLHLILMLVLTFSTGVIDAVGYLGLNRVFTGNMTGNVVILGMALVGADGLPVLGPAIALAAFMLGALVAGRILKHGPAGWSRRTTGLFAAVGVILTAIAAVLFVRPPGAADPWAMVITGGMAAAMGVQAATARHLSVKDVTTVVVTSTLTGLAADSRFGGGKGQHSGRRFWAVTLILCGAAAGAALLNLHIGFGVLLSAMLTLVVTCVGALGARPARRPLVVEPVETEPVETLVVELVETPTYDLPYWALPKPYGGNAMVELKRIYWTRQALSLAVVGTAIWLFAAVVVLALSPNGTNPAIGSRPSSATDILRQVFDGVLPAVAAPGVLAVVLMVTAVIIRSRDYRSTRRSPRKSSTASRIAEFDLISHSHTMIASHPISASLAG